ncbi:MAG: YSC84-related protein [Sulfurovum sp.]|nr:YSC84-related protein [Sulfurovum sp.]
MKHIIAVLLFVSTMSFGASKAVLDAQIKEALIAFEEEIPGGNTFIANAKGYMIFPQVIKAGFVIGGEHGEGILIENNSSIPKSYYSMTSASIGLQAGAQTTTYVIVFTTAQMLHSFKVSNGIEGSIDGSIAIAKWGKGKDISSLSFEKPIIVFAFSQKGLMYNLNVKGTKFTKIDK